MHKPTPLLTVVFDTPFSPDRLRYFRGAVQEAATEMADNGADFTSDQLSFFHNHGEEEGSVIHRYPLIQYQIKMRRPSITGIGEGAKILSTFLLHKPAKLETHRGDLKLTVAGLQNYSWKPELREPRQYIINKWLPLNPDNYRKWMDTDKLAERVKLLDKALWGNLFELAEAVGYSIPREELILHATSIDLKTYKKCYENTLLALDVVFTTNLNLPDEVGLGHGKSIGFGKVRQMSK